MTDNEDGFVRFQAVDDHVDNLTLYEYEKNRVCRETQIGFYQQGRKGYCAVDDDYECAEAESGVFIDDHGDYIAASRGGSGLEYHSDAYSVKQSCENSVEEIVGYEEFRAFCDCQCSHRCGKCVFYEFAAVYQRLVSPICFYQKGEKPAENDGYDCFYTETRSQDDASDYQKWDFHAHKVDCEFHSGQSCEYIRQSIDAAGGKVIRHCEYHVRNHEKQRTEEYIRVCFEPLF